MLLAALKLQLVALVTVAGVNTDELSSKSGDVVKALTTLSEVQQKALKDPTTDLNGPFSAAVDALKKLPDDADANYVLALWARMRLVNGVDEATILKMYEKAAEKVIPAKAELGTIYLQNFPQDQEKVKAGVKLIQDAEAAGNAGARRALAQLTLQGVGGIARNVEKAIALYEAGSKLNDGAATYSLYQIYNAGISERQNDGSTKPIVEASATKALEYLKKSADQGFPQGMTDYATLLFRGKDDKGTDKNPDAAIKMFEEAAQKGSASANRSLGQIYEAGLGDKAKNIDKAAEYYMLGARGGDGAAQFWMGNATQNGLAKASAIAKAEEAQKKNEKYEVKPEDVLLAPNPTQALTWYRLAAQNNIPAALYAVGVYYENGAVVDRDANKAFALVQRAAQSGLPVAMYRLGTYYQNGFGIGQDVVAAAAWFERSAKAEFPAAKLVYGALLENGVGVEKNPTAAAKNYEEAANAGLPQAMVNLAQLYERGDGVPKDLKRAWVLISLASDATGGNKDAIEYRAKLEAGMNDADKAQAKKDYEAAKAKGPATGAASAATPAAPASSGSSGKSGKKGGGK